MKERLLFFILFLILKVDISLAVTQQIPEPYIHNSISKVTKLNTNFSVYTTVDTLSGSEAWSLIQNDRMDNYGSQTNPGMNVKDRSFWLLFTVQNKTEDEDIYLEIDYPQLDYIQLYQLEGDSTILLHETGDRFIFSQRPIAYRNFILPVSIQLNDQKTFLLNVDKRSSAIRFPISIYSSQLLLPRVMKENIYYGTYFGFFILISIVCMIIGILLKRILFVWYSLYIVCFTLWIFSRLGFSYQYILPNYPELNTHFFPAVTSSGIMFLILYIMSFFDTKNTIPRFHKLMRGAVTFIISFFFIWALIPDQFLKFAPILFLIKYAITFLVIAFAYIAAIKFIKRDAFRSRMFILAYSVLFLGIGSIIFGEYGLGEDTFFIDPFMLGFLIEVIVLTILMIVIVMKILSQKEELSSGNQQLSSLLRQVRSKKEEPLQHLILNSKAVLPLDDIKYIKSDDHYLEFFLSSSSKPEIDRNQLVQVLSNLPPSFRQIHRSTIVNVNYIKTVQSTKVTLKDGEELKLSRTYSSAIKDYFSSNQ